MKIYILFFFCFLICVCAQDVVPTIVPSAEASTTSDVIIFKNGDRLTGQITNWDNNTLIVAGTAMGEVKIPWENVAGLESGRPLFFRTTDDNIVAGIPNGVINGQQVITSHLAGRVTINRDQLLMAGPTNSSVNPEYITLQKELEKSKEDLSKATEISKVWSGYLQLNFSGSTGNTESSTFASIAHVERTAYMDKFIAHLDARYGKTNGEKSVQEVSGYLRENVDITQRLYIYGRIEAKWDEIKDINFSVMAELGSGVHILKEGDFELFTGDKVTLDFDLGISYTATDFEDSEDTHSAGMVARIQYKHIFTNNWVFTATGTYVQDFKEPANKRNADDFDGYRLKFEALLEVPVTTIFSLTTSIRHEYDNAPVAGKERNDFYWLMGLKLNL